MNDFFERHKKYLIPLFITIIVFVVIEFFRTIHFFSDLIGKPICGQESLYWLFSSSAQTISAFIAFF